MSVDKYLFDSDSLVMAHRQHYSPNFCSAFWDWMLEGNQRLKFYTIDKVANELKKGTKKDYLHQFIELHHASFVLDTQSDISCAEKYGKIQYWANNKWTEKKSPVKTAKALEIFANEKLADPWLVAYASTHGYAIVSNEVSAPQAQNSVKLPDVADAFGVKVLKLYEVLNLHAEKNFSFK